MALFRVRGVSRGAYLCRVKTRRKRRKRGKDRQQDNGGARGVSWRVFQDVKERLKTLSRPTCRTWRAVWRGILQRETGTRAAACPVAELLTFRGGDLCGVYSSIHGGGGVFVSVYRGVIRGNRDTANRERYTHNGGGVLSCAFIL